jgi:hypothetical protein
VLRHITVLLLPKMTMFTAGVRLLTVKWAPKRLSVLSTDQRKWPGLSNPTQCKINTLRWSNAMQMGQEGKRLLQESDLSEVCNGVKNMD